MKTFKFVKKKKERKKEKERKEKERKEKKRKERKKRKEKIFFFCSKLKHCKLSPELVETKHALEPTDRTTAAAAAAVVLERLLLPSWLASRPPVSHIHSPRPHELPGPTERTQPASFRGWTSDLMTHRQRLLSVLE